MGRRANVAGIVDLCHFGVHVNALGLYDLGRNISPVGLAYKHLIDQWREVLPTQSWCLQVPVLPPSEQGMLQTRPSSLQG